MFPAPFSNRCDRTSKFPGNLENAQLAPAVHEIKERISSVDRSTASGHKREYSNRADVLASLLQRRTDLRITDEYRP
jgi:hypothetical protein